MLASCLILPVCVFVRLLCLRMFYFDTLMLTLIRLHISALWLWKFEKAMCQVTHILFDELSVATVCFSMGQADAGGSGIVSRRLTGQQSGADQFVMMIPNNKVWMMLLIGSYNYFACSILTMDKFSGGTCYW